MSTKLQQVLIEYNKKRSEFLATNLKSVNVTNGDGLDNTYLG